MILSSLGILLLVGEESREVEKKNASAWCYRALILLLKDRFWTVFEISLFFLVINQIQIWGPTWYHKIINSTKDIHTEEYREKLETWLDYKIGKMLEYKLDFLHKLISCEIFSVYFCSVTNHQHTLIYILKLHFINNCLIKHKVDKKAGLKIT